jgi:hypothetical protein
MDGAAWGFVGALAGAAIGAGASIATTVVSSRNARQLQLQADQLERSERARAFQRDNLLAVQEAMQDVARVAGRTYYEDLANHRAGAKWGSSLVSDELNEATLVANRRLSALVERIHDDSLREEVRSVHSEFTWVGMASSEAEAERRHNAAGSMFADAMRHLGEVLRAQY